jgi:hypothetical protein
MKFNIFYTGSPNKKNPHNLVNHWNEEFRGTKKNANIHAQAKKKELLKQEIITGRAKVEICRATGI